MTTIMTCFPHLLLISLYAQCVPLSLTVYEQETCFMRLPRIMTTLRRLIYEYIYLLIKVHQPIQKGCVGEDNLKTPVKTEAV